MEYRSLYPNAKLQPSGKALGVVGTMYDQAAWFQKLKTFFGFLRFYKTMRGYDLANSTVPGFQIPEFVISPFHSKLGMYTYI
jgi:hypothetical protein